MSVRKLLLLLGIVFVIAGLWLAVVWVKGVSVHTAQTAQQPQNRPALLAALHPLPSGTLLREGDIGWKEIPAGQVGRSGQLLRGEASESEFLGAITRRDFAEGEPLMASELVKPSDRRFLAAVLQPGHRAVSISVDAPQSSSGLVLPGDHVDVILTQNFGDNIATIAYRSAGETVLHNVRVVAVDQSLGTQAKATAKVGVAGTDTRVPKTITLELSERQAQMLFVAVQLGKLQLAVRPLEGSGAARVEEARQQTPTWAADVSKAIAEIGSREIANKRHGGEEKESRKIARNDMGVRQLLPASSGSTLEHLVRYPPPYAAR